MTLFLANSKEAFIEEIKELFEGEIREVGYGIGDEVLAKKCYEKGIEYYGLGDEALFKAFGTLESYREEVSKVYRQRKEQLINKINSAVTWMAAGCRMNPDVKLYPSYNPNDTYKIAEIAFDEVSEFYLEDCGI